MQKIPELAKGVGEGITEFKNATNKAKKEVEEAKTNVADEPVKGANSEKPNQEAKSKTK